MNDSELEPISTPTSLLRLPLDERNLQRLLVEQNQRHLVFCKACFLASVKMEPQNEYTQTNDSLPLMIRVRAPATLPAGYTFEALLNDDPNRPFTCEVVCLLYSVSLC